MAEQNTGAPPAPIRFDAPTSAAAPGGESRPPATALACAACGSPIGAYYYEAAGAAYCARCKRETEESAASAGGFGRAALFGLGAAALGAIAYYAFIAITGLYFALITIGMAALIATAIAKGNGGRRSRRLQLLAVGLTYLSIAGALAPGMLATLMEGGGHVAVGAVVVVAFGSPVISVLAAGFPGAVLNFAIIGFALMRAWRMSGDAGPAAGARTFTGPYKVGARESAA